MNKPLLSANYDYIENVGIDTPFHPSNQSSFAKSERIRRVQWRGQMSYNHEGFCSAGFLPPPPPSLPSPPWPVSALKGEAVIYSGACSGMKRRRSDHLLFPITFTFLIINTILAFSYPSPTDDSSISTHQMENIFAATKRALVFMLRNYKTMNLDGAMGIRILQGK